VFGGGGGCILNENGISSVGNDCVKDVIIDYFVSLKFFCIGWPFESMLPLLSRYGRLLVVRIDTIQFGDCMLWLGSNRHITWKINRITIGNKKLMCAKVVFLSIRGFKVIFFHVLKGGDGKRARLLWTCNLIYHLLLDNFVLSKVVVRISNIPKGASFMY